MRTDWAFQERDLKETGAKIVFFRHTVVCYEKKKIGFMNVKECEFPTVKS